MSEKIAELTGKTSKLSMKTENSKKSLNWCNLPLEMRSACIKKMDFMTKNRLRATAKLEKSLVEADKHYCEFKTVEIVYKFKKLRVKAENIVSTRPEQPNQVVVKCIRRILKMGNIDTLKLVIWGKMDEFFKEFKKSGPFRIRNVRSECTGEAATLFFLKNLTKPVEVLSLNIEKSNGFKLSDFLKLPTPKLLRIEHLSLSLATSVPFFSVIEHWIENDIELGSRLEMSDGLYSPTGQFPYDKMRFPCKNPAKEILMRRGKNLELFNDYIVGEVIPASRPESDDEF